MIDIKKRINEAISIGLHYDPRHDSYVGENPPGANIALVEMKTMTDIEFADVITKINNAKQEPVGHV